MKYITLTQGKVATVCDCHYDLVAEYKWYATQVRKSKLWYAVRSCRNTTPKRQYMHRAISGEEVAQTDHIDGEGLNNQCSNLRPATRSQNQFNTCAPRTNTSGHKGVSLHQPSGKWVARLRSNGRSYSAGYFFSLEDAITAYEELASKYHKEFARF